MGFAVPLARWFRGPLRQRVRDELLAGRLLETGWFNPDAIQRLVTQHESGLHDHSTPIWVLLMFGAFLKNNLQTD
jgi:asparagine synthase (glutamine-hydrolysing)